MIRVALIDDHSMVRHAFRQLLEDEDDIEVVIEAGTGANLDDLMACSPDVFVVDIALNDDATGLDLIRHSLSPGGYKTLVLSMYDHEPYVTDAKRAGASGFLSKNGAIDELASAVRTVAQGGSAFNVETTLSTKTCETALLSDREREVCELLITGNSPKQISIKLNISPKTVYAHRRAAFHKLGMSSERDLLDPRWRRKEPL